MHVFGKDGAHIGEQMVFAAGLQGCLQFARAVEMILDGPFLTPGDEDKLTNARRYRLFDGILDQGFVDDGKHFLGACLGGGEKSGPQSRDGKDGLFDYRVHWIHVRCMSPGTMSIRLLADIGLGLSGR